MSAAASGAAEGLFKAVGASFSRSARSFGMHPYRSLFVVAAAVGAVWAYEVKVVHKDQVVSMSTGNVFEMATTDEERQQHRRVKAERVLTPQELQAAKDAADAPSPDAIKQRIAMLEQEKKASKPTKPGSTHADNGTEEDANIQTLFVTSSHLQMKEGTFRLRNAERNFSILAQDQYKQKDNYNYRMERSKDDDYGRLSAKK